MITLLRLRPVIVDGLEKLQRGDCLSFVLAGANGAGYARELVEHEAAMIGLPVRIRERRQQLEVVLAA